VTRKASKATARPAEIVREYGPFPGVETVRGVTFDGADVWFATGERLQSFEPESGRAGRALEVRADAGTAFDGRHLFQLAGDRIQKIDPRTGEVVATVPAPSAEGNAGLTWAEGTLWVGLYRDRKIHQIDPDTGRILRTVESTRFVTGVTFVDGDLWHGTWEGETTELRRIDPATGRVLETLEMPDGVSGLEAKGDLLFCGGIKTPVVRAVKRPARK
jgi:outer membrane protein assembly factor BamB